MNTVILDDAYMARRAQQKAFSAQIELMRARYGGMSARIEEAQAMALPSPRGEARDKEDYVNGKITVEDLERRTEQRLRMEAASA